MHFHAITIFPDMFDALKHEGIIARALKSSLIELSTHQLRNFSTNAYRSVDDDPYGGGAGMVMTVEPIRKCIKHIKASDPHTKVIYLSPKGQKLTHNLCEQLSKEESITLLCGRYEGVDERITQHDIDMEISIGDYVISGGELAAMVLIDAVSRQIPGVLGNAESLNDSFSNGLLDYPQYTRPREIDGQVVPEVLLSGNDKLIKQWREEQAKRLTEGFLKLNNDKLSNIR